MVVEEIRCYLTVHSALNLKRKFTVPVDVSTKIDGAPGAAMFLLASETICEIVFIADGVMAASSGAAHDPNLCMHNLHAVSERPSNTRRTDIDEQRMQAGRTPYAGRHSTGLPRRRFVFQPDCGSVRFTCMRLHGKRKIIIFVINFIQVDCKLMFYVINVRR